MEHTHLVISCRKRSFLEIALLGGLDTCCKNALFISWASYALLDSNMFKFFIKKKVDCHISRDVSFPISVFYWERFFLKQSSLFPSPYSSSGGGAELPHWRSGRGPRHLQLSFCTSLLFRVCVQEHVFWLVSASQVSWGLLPWHRAGQLLWATACDFSNLSTDEHYILWYQLSR